MNRITTVNAIIINEYSELLVVNKKGNFLLPGGKLEPNETDLEALSRELDEETGLELIKAKKFKTYNFRKALVEKNPLQMRIYIVQSRGNPYPNNEVSEVLWLSKERYIQKPNFPKKWWDPIFYDLKKENILTLI